MLRKSVGPSFPGQRLPVSRLGAIRGNLSLRVLCVWEVPIPGKPVDQETPQGENAIQKTEFRRAHLVRASQIQGRCEGFERCVGCSAMRRSDAPRPHPWDFPSDT